MNDEGTKGLSPSQDEAERARLMGSSQKGNAGGCQQLLLRIRSVLAKYFENSFARFGLGTGNGQEDVLQKVLLAIHVKRHTYDPQQFFLPWMSAVGLVTNLLIISEKTKRSKRPPVKRDFQKAISKSQFIARLKSCKIK
jgi:DNA-directed RNA polymerase specialized sigma24 family protein